MAKPKPTCQHDPLAPRCTLRIESSMFCGSRVRCLICEKVNQLGQRSGKFDPLGAMTAAESASTVTGDV